MEFYIYYEYADIFGLNSLENYEEFSSLYFTLIDRKPASFMIKNSVNVILTIFY